jgi:site-specific DNA-methyltransferase (adenine-specific)
VPTPYYESDVATLYLGDCRDIAPKLDEVACAVTSPPYAEQRAKQYGGIPEADYPGFTAEWMSAVPLAPTGSVILNIRSHLRDGAVSPYVLKTRLALHEEGWVECEELIWLKPGAGGPFGSNYRPRRTWESLLWLSRSGRPWVDVKANGTQMTRDTPRRKTLKGVGDYIHSLPTKAKGTPTRCADVVEVAPRANAGAEDHPAPYPPALAEWCVRLIGPPGGVVLDPFAGSGSTLVAAVALGRPAIGIEKEERFCEIAARRLDALSIIDSDSEPILPW